MCPKRRSRMALAAWHQFFLAVLKLLVRENFGCSKEIKNYFQIIKLNLKGKT